MLRETGRRLVICAGTLLYSTTDSLSATVTHRCDNVPQPVVVHSRQPLPRPPTILLGNHILVKFNFVIIIAEGRGSLAPWRCGIAWDIKSTWKSFYRFLVGRKAISCFKKERNEAERPAIPIFLFKCSPTGAAMSRTIDKFRECPRRRLRRLR